MPRGKISRRLFLGHTLASVLALPARAEPPSSQDGFRVLEAREGKLSLLTEPASPTAVWSYNGEVPGPLLRFKKDEEVKVRLVNKLGQPASLNWHGVRIVNAMDGVAGLTQEPVPPGGSFDYRFTPPDSGLYWYHPHALPFIGEQLDRGLYGVMIVDERDPPAADRDMLVVLADWKLDGKGQLASFDAGADAGAGRIGPLVTLNSRAVPVAETLPPSSRLRLRVLSAVDTRLMLIAFNGVRPLILAVDGQPCEAFEPVRQMIPLGPGARFDVMLDLPGDAESDANVTLLGDNEPDRVLLAFKTAGEKRSPLPPVASLPQNPRLPSEIKLQASRKVDILIEAIASMGTGPSSAVQNRPLYWKLNGKAVPGFAPAPLFSVKRGTPVTLGFVNHTAFVQQIHVHGHAMRLLHDLDDGWEPYWRDAVLVPEGKTKHVAFVADNPGKWVIECLMAGRQATGMATWFEVS
ncbi:MAG TPA: multicopper oxidase family protein [Methylocella sp.]|jgi:FtsP/CotA-like multicopper oxidase with cupredoxin domain|nr:multicopper oxidase family protein [Methylocella sp.]